MKMLANFSTSNGRTAFALAMAAICFWASARPASADSTLWYNGDFDGNSAAYNELNPFATNSTGFVYDDFIVPTGQTWIVQGVFSNDQMMGFTKTTLSAYWEIRSGVSDGNGGVLVASDTSFATQTPTNNVGFFPSIPWPFQASP
jgi:hypothetical protein